MRSDKSEFLSFVRDELACGVRGKGLSADKRKLLATRNDRKKDRLPVDVCAVLDLEPGTTFADAVGNSGKGKF
jgi:hypothetical protein